MWDDIIIGEGNKGNSAVLVRKLPGGNNGLSIAHNSVSYWIGGGEYDVGMTIFKNSEKGIQLTAMLTNCQTDEVMLEWFDKIIFTMLPVEKIKRKIRAMVEAAHDEGRRYQAREIRAALKYGDYS